MVRRWLTAGKFELLAKKSLHSAISISIIAHNVGHTGTTLPVVVLHTGRVTKHSSASITSTQRFSASD